MKTACFELLLDEAMPNEQGDAIDWKTTVIATSQTINALLSFARLKKLNLDLAYYIEGEYIEWNDRIQMPESERIGFLNELL